MTVDVRSPLQGDVRVVKQEDGTRIHTVSSGSGPTVVLAHGFAIDSGEWNVVAADLVSRGCRVVAFDQRGHGRTTIGRDGVGSRQMASDYAAVLAAYDVSDAVLVMHSMGGVRRRPFPRGGPRARRPPPQGCHARGHVRR